MFYKKHWKIDEPSKIVYIIHGMSEHIERYDRFAKSLNQEGFAVMGMDLRGHGQTAGDIESIGFFTHKNGWDIVKNDILDDLAFIRKDHPSVPIVVFGHSMGSFFARSIAMEQHDLIQGYIWSGTSGHPGWKGVAGKPVAKLLSYILGKQKKSPLLMGMTYANFNRRIKNVSSNFDWLSRDKEEVAKYENDPFCIQVFTNQFFVDLAEGVTRINQSKFYNNLNKELPYLLISGSDDPVGYYGKGPQEVHNKMTEVGIKNCNLNLYPEGRHELLNDINRDEVTHDVILWLKQF